MFLAETDFTVFTPTFSVFEQAVNSIQAVRAVASRDIKAFFLFFGIIICVLRNLKRKDNAVFNILYAEAAVVICHDTFYY